MSQQRPQSLSNHAKFVPGYHYVTFSLAVVVLIWSAIRLFQYPTVDRVAVVLLVLALIGATCCTLLAFILPAWFHHRLHARQMTTRQEAFNLFLVLFGVLGWVKRANLRQQKKNHV